MTPAVRTFTMTLLATALIALAGVASLTGIGSLVSDEPVEALWGPKTYGTLRPQPTFARSGQYGPDQQGEPFRLPEWVGQLLTVVVVAVMALIVVRFLFMVAASIEKRRNAVAIEASSAVPVDVEIELDEVQESIAVTLDDLRAGVDVHGAIIECWRRLADVAAASGVPRRASQTAEEYTLAILGSLPVDRYDLRTLADLYEAAMFSGEEPAPTDRDVAIACLDRLTASLVVGR